MCTLNKQEFQLKRFQKKKIFKSTNSADGTCTDSTDIVKELMDPFASEILQFMESLQSQEPSVN